MQTNPNPSRRHISSRCSDSVPHMADYAFPQDVVTVRVDGRHFGDHGKVEFTLAGQLVDVVVLPKVEWAVFAILAEAARNAPVHSLDAFISSSQLAYRLKKEGVVAFADPQNAIRSVYRLRKRLGKLKIAELLRGPAVSESAFDFASVLITRGLLGYRINLPPDDIELQLPVIQKKRCS